MKSLVRLLLMGVILAFAAGSVVPAVEMAGMNAGMASMTDGMAPDCDGCGGDNDGGAVEKACPDVCVTPVIAILPATTAVAAQSSHIPVFLLAGPIIGRSGPPDPYPPKPVLT